MAINGHFGGHGLSFFDFGQLLLTYCRPISFSMLFGPIITPATKFEWQHRNTDTAFRRYKRAKVVEQVSGIFDIAAKEKVINDHPAFALSLT